ncbi:hypothetical protein [Litoreibacter janthinus]|uniref:Lipoprotein n=1 Tax=Litoreibacter janthinus TaxID=670154 RepID=A0A1I6FVQ8_9RHOB|nr:hypothetical protein [Litoreibacter janthinus]SFR34042.1 hypothetical protein SAMN04488002_0418 [Litoreibacter janthinus]
MRRTLLAVLFAAATLAGCKTSQGSDALALSFSAYKTTPVMVTHFSIEKPLAPTPPFIPGGIADEGPPRFAGVSSGDAPVDRGADGVWQVSARWVELTTDRAWEASVDVPVDEVNIDLGAYSLTVIMGPNGLLLIGSDLAGTQKSDMKDIARSCGARVPEDDKAWRLETEAHTGLKTIMSAPRGPVTNPECPTP